MTVTAAQVLGDWLTARKAVHTAEWIHVGGINLLRVEIDPRSPVKSRALESCLELITVRDMICGQFRASDPYYRLSVRGWMRDWAPDDDSGQVVIVVAYHRQNEWGSAQLVRQHIHEQNARVLVGDLVELEEQAHGAAPVTTQADLDRRHHASGQDFCTIPGCEVCP